MTENGKLVTNGFDGGLDTEGQMALIQTAVTGDPKFLMEAIENKGQELIEAVSRSGGPIQAVVAEIQAEYRAYLEIQMTLLQSRAIDTLGKVMDGADYDNASSMVSAANSVLSRGMFPMRSRQESLSVKIPMNNTLPDFGQILERAETEDERLRMADKMTALLADLDSIRGTPDDDQET